MTNLKRSRVRWTNRLAELAVMWKTDVEDILGAQLALPGTTLGGTEGTGSQCIGGEFRERASGGAETSIPKKFNFPICRKRKSSLLGESSGNRQAPTSSRVNFEIGEEEAPAAKRVVVDEGMCNRLETGN